MAEIRDSDDWDMGMPYEASYETDPQDAWYSQACEESRGFLDEPAVELSEPPLVADEPAQQSEQTPQPGNFVHLHTHSEYSALDGLGKLPELVAAAAADNNPAIAITDHGTLSGAWKLDDLARENGIKPIVGIEAYLAYGDRFAKGTGEVDPDDEDTEDEDTDGGAKRQKRAKKYMHLTLLAATEDGWHNLVAISNKAQDSFWSKPRIDYDLIAEHSEGLIVLTGCIGGPLGYYLNRAVLSEARGERTAAGELRAQARTNLDRLVDAVGKDNVFIEVMDHSIPAQLRVADELRRLSEETGIPLVATNDAHYVKEEHSKAHEAWLAVSSRKTLDDPKRFKFHGSGHHLRTEQEMRALFDGADWWQTACDNTVLVADRIADRVLPEPKIRLPHFPVPAGYEHSSDYLRDLVREGAFDRYGEDPNRPGKLPPKVNERLKYEFEIINTLGFADYFLLVWDVITWARSQNIRVGPGRGSAAGSVVSYCLGIVGIDPLRHNLLFERFLDLTRKELPDIDTDFEQGRRGEVLAYFATKWGHDQVAQLGTFGIARTKQAIKDAARVLGKTPLGNKLSEKVPSGGGKAFSFAKLDDESDPATADFRNALAKGGEDALTITELARAFEDTTRQPGVHACGVVLSDEPMTALIPTRNNRSKDASIDAPRITEWEGPDIEAYGLVKMDFLGLRNLDVISRCLEMIETNTGETFEPDELDPDNPQFPERDARVWEMLQAGKTAGVFQLDSSGMTNLCVQVAPDRIDDLNALVALFRPGPLSANMHTQYADRKNGREEVSYDYLTRNPAEVEVIDSVLGVTFGTCLASDTPVYSISRNAYVPIRDIEVGETVLSVAEDDYTSSRGVVSHKVMTGTKPTVVTRFSNGSIVRSTRDHLFLTPYGWKRADELTTDTPVAAPWSLPSAEGETNSFGEARARVLGYLLGDGYLAPASTSFVNESADLHRAFADAVAEAFPGDRVRPVYSKGGIVPRSFVTNGMGHGGRACGVNQMLRDFGLRSSARDWKKGGAKSASKFVPMEWMNASDTDTAALLGAMWDCDGHISISSNGAWTAHYKTISTQMARDVVCLLARHGIPATDVTHTYESSKGTRTAHQIMVGSTSQERFNNVIAPYMKSRAKIIAAATLAQTAGNRGEQSSYYPRELLRSAVIQSGRSFKSLGRACGVSPRSLGMGTASAAQFASPRIVRALGEELCDQKLASAADVRWVTIVEQVQSEATEVWDITVEGTHNFVADGVVVHNCVYQEQLMRLGEVVAGFDAGQKSFLRKAVSKKKKEMVSKSHQDWLAGGVLDHNPDGSPKVAFSRDTLEELWRVFEGSASYLFNASHSAAYAFVSYITAYLKANWPNEYAAAVLSCTDNDAKRLVTLIDMAAEGLNVLPPDVNEGLLHTSSDGTSVRLGLAEVKGVGVEAEKILAAREADGPFTSLADLMARTRLTVSKLEALIEAGACDCFGPRLGLMMIARSCLTPDKEPLEIPVPDARWGEQEAGARQRARLGCIVGRHPLLALRDQLKTWTFPSNNYSDYGQELGRRPRPIKTLMQAEDGAKAETLGILSEWSTRAYRGGMMANMVIEGSSGSIRGVVFDNALQTIRRTYGGEDPQVGDLIAVSGKVQVRVREFERINEEGETVTETETSTEMLVWEAVPVDIDDAAMINLPLPEGDPIAGLTVIPEDRDGTATPSPSSDPATPPDRSEDGDPFQQPDLFAPLDSLKSPDPVPEGQHPHDQESDPPPYEDDNPALEEWESTSCGYEYAYEDPFDEVLAESSPTDDVDQFSASTVSASALDPFAEDDSVPSTQGHGATATDSCTDVDEAPANLEPIPYPVVLMPIWECTSWNDAELLPGKYHLRDVMRVSNRDDVKNLSMMRGVWIVNGELQGWEETMRSSGKNLLREPGSSLFTVVVAFIPDGDEFHATQQSGDVPHVRSHLEDIKRLSSTPGWVPIDSEAKATTVHETARVKG